MTGASSPIELGPYHHGPSAFYDLGSCPRVLLGQNLQKGVSVHQFNETNKKSFVRKE